MERLSYSRAIGTKRYTPQSRIDWERELPSLVFVAYQAESGVNQRSRRPDLDGLLHEVFDHILLRTHLEMHESAEDQ